MLRAFVLLAAAAAGSAAFGAALAPGEWEFVSVTTSALLSRPQSVTFRRCLRQADVENPDRWMFDAGEQGDCKIVPGKKTDDTYAWEMTCPKSGMRGTGSMRMTGATMSGETLMSGEAQGRKFELRTRTAGKRLGPCKP